ncbi:MAG TPA: LEPR-XLL domain-containing protein [Verrucomicrobiales bacterium]|nr:LEPR-XLL domain-containing protein [Verrucomicrobiales bacterium]HIL68223.1 LEPR-XLL domain-containing protein [Verrucomicrobiota bacterium]
MTLRTHSEDRFKLKVLEPRILLSAEVGLLNEEAIELSDWGEAWTKDTASDVTRSIEAIFADNTDDELGGIEFAEMVAGDTDLAMNQEGGSQEESSGKIENDFLSVTSLNAVEPVAVSFFTVIDFGLNKGGVQRSGIDSIEFQLNQPLAELPNASALVLNNLTSGGTVSPQAMHFEYAEADRSLIWTFPGLENGVLEEGNYLVRLLVVRTNS